MSPSRGARRRSPARLALALVLLALRLVPADAAVSNADLIAYLGGSATGQTLSTVAYSLTMLANETSVLVSLSVDKSMGEVGWLGWGRGTAMTDADILILWPNAADGTWTLSHRTASSTVMPTLVGSPAKDDPSADASGQVRVVAALSSAGEGDSPCVVTFERLLSLEDADGYGGKDAGLEKAVNQPIIYAYGDDNPGDSAQETDLKQHALDAMGGTYVDLSAEFTSDTAAIEPPLSPIEGGGSSSGGSSSTASSGGSSSTATGSKTSSATGTAGGEEPGAAPTATGAGSASSSGSSTGSSSSSASTASGTSSSSNPSYKTLIKAHAICAGAVWAFFAPLGALQGLLTTPLTLVAVGLALWAVKVKGGTGLSYPHKTVGFCLVGLLLVQDGLGLWTHLSHAPAPRGGGPAPRAVQGWLHIALGVALICGGFYQVHLGLERYGVSDKVTLYAYYGHEGSPDDSSGTTSGSDSDSSGEEHSPAGGGRGWKGGSSSSDSGDSSSDSEDGRLRSRSRGRRRGR
ncbi:hypothetical protein JCM10450v2_000576 [Rhodotorula kratochvilovae]